MRFFRTGLVLAGPLLALGCASPVEQSVPALANAHVVADFASYKLMRVGIVPVSGDDLAQPESIEFQDALMAEFMANSRFEVIELRSTDLEETPPLEAHRRGWYSPRTILELSHRHRLDALLIPTVTDRQTYPPQRLGLQVDLVASETGQTIWNASLHIDASEVRVRDAMKIWVENRQGDLSEHSWEMVMISPARFARFAAHQVAAML
tara:strand:- start:1516 stop:2139 length:624 start_codon:yes stop_codon:yes gene_type:complete